jgi:hypothetical protein
MNRKICAGPRDAVTNRSRNEKGYDDYRSLTVNQCCPNVIEKVDFPELITH